jgi:hypothetical protein
MLSLKFPIESKLSETRCVVMWQLVSEAENMIGFNILPRPRVPAQETRFPGAQKYL